MVTSDLKERLLKVGIKLLNTLPCSKKDVQLILAQLGDVLADTRSSRHGVGFHAQKVSR